MGGEGMKVLMIDPWGIKSVEKYTKGLCSALGKNHSISQLFLITNYFFPQLEGEKIRVLRWFFRFSEKMERSKTRKFLRGLEYLWAYLRIYLFIRKNSFDVIHFQWLLVYRFDAFMVGVLKRYCSKLVYTAHNAKPHVKKSEKMDVLKKIYDTADEIVVHGQSVKNEIISTFGIDKEKIKIQRHGTKKIELHNPLYEKTKEQEKIKKLINDKKMVFLCLGNMFYNKGVDRLIDIWLENDFSDCFLIIAGKKSRSYNELFEREEKIKKEENILYIDHFVSTELHDFFINNSDILLVVYRHATVSGVIFSAAEFKKPVICTDVGSLKEYVVDKKTGFIVNNNKQEIRDKMLEIKEISKERLKEMGENNFSFVNQYCNWELITQKLVKEVYLK